MYYQQVITGILKKMGRSDVDPRHVEGWMRCEHSTLDALSPTAFKKEVKIAVQCIDGPEGDVSETLAKSYGL